MFRKLDACDRLGPVPEEERVGHYLLPQAGNERAAAKRKTFDRIAAENPHPAAYAATFPPRGKGTALPLPPGEGSREAAR